MTRRSPKRPSAAKVPESSRWTYVYYAAALVAIGAVVIAVLNTQSPNSPIELPQPPDETRRPAANVKYTPIELPEITPTRFRNASSSVAYVGNGQCLDCHREEHKSYLETTHSRSMATVDVTREPPDGEYHHALSGRSYRVYRDQSTLRLREFVQDNDDREVVLVDHAAQYVLGSGNYARMYLVQLGDFLVEAPVTWYPRQDRWGMSAGYGKNPHQPGFNREVDAKCLQCHAGRVTMIDGASERLEVVEPAISCERCHGPGELHVAERRKELPVSDGVDDSIVNLRHLSREEQEDICSQCHLSSSAEVNVHGRSKLDFRPGLRMSDFIVNYRVDRPDAAMTVSGQIEQMRLSRCYIESKSMTCTTCHDPHSRPDDAQRVEHFRDKCLSCHQDESCGVSLKDRQQGPTRNNCMECHMPRGPTDIPHFSFTHHRIGNHSTKAHSEKLTAADRLVPVVEVSHLPELERQRLLGLANDMFAGKLATGLDDETKDDPTYRTLATVFENRSREILDRVRTQGVRDSEVEAFYSRVYWRRDPPRCIESAKRAMAMPDIVPATRKSMLYMLASSLFDLQRYDEALPELERLVKIERNEISLMLLAVCHQRMGNLKESVRLAQQAIQDSPDRADLHVFLASAYRQLGQSREAEAELERAKLLRVRVPQPE